MQTNNNIKSNRATIKKTVIILSIFALLAVGCKPKITPTSISIPLITKDSLYLLKMPELRKQFQRYPAVSAKEISEIAPVIKKWTDFYNVDFAQARLVRIDSVCFKYPLDTLSPYHWIFSEDNDTDNLLDIDVVDYSPDKQRYVDLDMYCRNKYCFFPIREEDICESVFTSDCVYQVLHLADRKQKHFNSILRLGNNQLAEATFWKSNDIFIVVGLTYTDISPSYIARFVYVFDIAKQTRNHYEIIIDTKIEKGSKFDEYLPEVNLKERGFTLKQLMHL